MVFTARRFHATMAAWIFGLTALTLPALAQAPSPTTVGEGAGPVNTVCPVLTDEPVDPMFTAMYKGVKVGLCCRKCQRQFEADPEAYIANLPEFVTLGLTPAGAQGAGEHAHDEGEAAHQDAAEDEEHAHAEEARPVMGHEEDRHDHATDHEAQGPGVLSKLISWFGKFHPPATDLPISMLLGAAMAELGFMVTKKEMFRGAVTFCVWIAAAGALGAVTLGWFNGGFSLVDEEWVKTTHRWLGTSTALFSLITLALLIRTGRTTGSPPSRKGFRAALFTTATLVAVTGFFGGSLVYGINHYAW